MEPLNAFGDVEGRSQADAASDTTRLSSEQWTRVKAVFHEAVSRPMDEREAYIRLQCRGDAALEVVVRSLLASDRSASEFLEAPAVVRVGVPRPRITALTPGQRLGAYEIVGLLGAGGMGEVYRARDHRLARDVALKVLPVEVMHDGMHQQRLELEARAAAALDHPNICPVYDIGEQDGRVWIAMQYVEGETLAARLRREPLELSTALSVATQIASALSAAHARGIVHRDVKPDNIIIGTSGHAKVLDFGLAKIAAEDGPGARQSVQGGIYSRRLGTLPYMSPEQARGEPLDSRTDVFSLTVVLYEMVTGRRPFIADRDAEIRASILSATPPPVSSVVPTANPALDRIAQRGLQKDRTARYQTMADLMADIEDVKRRLEIASPRIDPRTWEFRSAVAASVIGVIAAWVWSSGRQPTTTNWSGALAYVQLTNFPDAVRSPAISSDGKILTFVRDDQSGVGQDLYVKELPDGQPRRLTDDGEIKSWPTFTPDGSRIVFTRGLDSFVVPISGGAPRPFMTNASGLTWMSPQNVLFSQMKKAPTMGIAAAFRDGTRRRDIYVPASATGMAHFSRSSPDGSQVLVVEMDTNHWLPCRVVPFDGSSPGRRVGPTPSECTAVGWSPDGRWMYFEAAVNGETHLWRQRFPDGAPEQLTFGLNQERGLAVDREGKTVITAVGASQSTVWYHDEHGDRRVSTEGFAYRPLVSPDERMVLYLVRRPAKRSFSIGELWATDLASGRNQRLLPEFLISSYHLSSDGTLIVFDTFDQSGRSRVWLASIDGSFTPRRLTPDGAQDERPFFGASGDIYLMRRRDDGHSDLYAIQQDGSRRRKLADDVDFLVSMSPDEKWAVLWSFQGTRLMSLGGGPPRWLCRCSIGPIMSGPPGVSWSHDGETLFVNQGNLDVETAVTSDGGTPVTGTVLVPWHRVEGWPSSFVPSGDDLSRLPGARSIPLSGVAPGRTAARYAFSQESRQANLYRIRLP
jgi:serine/threonine protein kinase/Tol biopolymer transport system component